MASSQHRDKHTNTHYRTLQVSGSETPSFIVSTGEVFALVVRVTSNSEQEPDTNAPHTCVKDVRGDPVCHFTHSSTNWFEGMSEYLVTLPSSTAIYTAHLQGCCRDKELGTNDRDGRGIVHMFDSSYHLVASVQLSRDPPPMTFIPAHILKSTLNSEYL
jgi:hypothetical protein